MMSTPSRWRASRTISAPVIVAPTTRRSKRKPPPAGGGFACCLVLLFRPREPPPLRGQEGGGRGLRAFVPSARRAVYRTLRKGCSERATKTLAVPLEPSTICHRWRRGIVGPSMSATLAQKIWDRHVVRSAPGEPDLLFVDLHLIHEVTTPQAFESLRMAGRRVRRPDLTVATMDHNTPTRGGRAAADETGRRQLDALEENCRWAGIRLFELGSRHQGIVHVIGPDLGLTQPGLVIVCGDSHTSTHGAFGAIAFGIGTSEVEHVLATQCLPQRRPRDLAVTIDGPLPPGVVAKDVVLGLIARAGIAGGQGCAVEYRGSTVRGLSMEGRMTVCNMSIEWGARVGMVAPDDTTFAYLEGRPHAPAGAGWELALEAWRALPSDPDAAFDQEIRLDATTLAPYVTWGTNPGQAAPVTGRV